MTFKCDVTAFSILSNFLKLRLREQDWLHQVAKVQYWNNLSERSGIIEPLFDW